MSYANLIDKKVGPDKSYVKYGDKGSFHKLYEDLVNRPKKKKGKHPLEPGGDLYPLVEQYGQEIMQEEENRRKQQEPGNLA